MAVGSGKIPRNWKLVKFFLHSRNRRREVDSVHKARRKIRAKVVLRYSECLGFPLARGIDQKLRGHGSLRQTEPGNGNVARLCRTLSLSLNSNLCYQMYFLLSHSRKLSVKMLFVHGLRLNALSLDPMSNK